MVKTKRRDPTPRSNAAIQGRDPRPRSKAAIQGNTATPRRTVGTPGVRETVVAIAAAVVVAAGLCKMVPLKFWKEKPPEKMGTALLKTVCFLKAAPTEAFARFTRRLPQFLL